MADFELNVIVSSDSCEYNPFGSPSLLWSIKSGGQTINLSYENMHHLVSKFNKARVGLKKAKKTIDDYKKVKTLLEDQKTQ